MNDQASREPNQAGQPGEVPEHQPSPGGGGGPQLVRSKQGQNMATLTHLSAFLGYLGVPFGNVIGPLVLWLLKREEHPEVETAGKDALNFQISMTIYGLVSLILCLIFIGFLLLAVLFVLDAVCIIVAAVKSSNGERFKYPLTIELIK